MTDNPSGFSFLSRFPVSTQGTDIFAMPFSLVPLRPWDAFDHLWTSIVGYPPQEFDWDYGVTPLSTWPEYVSVVVLYLLIAFGGQHIMRNREPFKLKTLTKLHNLFLTCLSASLLVLFLEQFIPTLYNEGFYQSICGESGYSRRLRPLYYVGRPSPLVVDDG
jgi:fatty acid elongase 3